MNFTYYALKLLAPKAKAFERATKNPLNAQKNLLLTFLKRNKKSEYGKKHNFSKIRSIKDYQATVLPSDYEKHRPLIDRMAKGEDNILTSDKAVFFGVTSGTTGKPKFIPVTAYSRAKKKEVMDLWVYHIACGHPDIFRGKILTIVSPEIERCVPSGLPCGSESGHGYKNLPPALKGLYSLPYRVFEINDYDAKYYCILRISMEHDIRTVATLNPSTIVLLCQKIEKMAGDIIIDIENGTLNKKWNIAPDIRKEIEKALRPNPKRANELKMLLKKNGRLLPKDFWPNMQLIECWKAGTVGLYLAEFGKYFGNVPVRDFGYLSSEARSSIPITDTGAGGILAIKANFYEFIPKEDIGKTEKRFLLCNELEIGREYFIVITTPGGLYRYNIDDLIRVDGFFNKTPLIEFVQKGLNVTSITGEKLYESQVVEAVKRASDAHKLFIGCFAASIQWGRTPCYEFLIEFTENPPLDKKKCLLESIDKELCCINVEYQTKRKSQRLKHPVLKVVCNGGFEKLRTKKVKEGAHDGQFKITQLTNEVDFHKHFDIQEEISLD